VHAFDLSFELLDRKLGREGLDNVVFHAGDSHVLLPELLGQLAQEGRNVDFALVDGDHSAEGVHQDVEDLLGSDAVSEGIVLVHDTMNEIVRAGLEEVSYEAHAKVAYVELDFVAGYMFREPSLVDELWGGLGLIVVEPGRPRPGVESPRQTRYREAHELVVQARETQMDLQRHREWLESTRRSASWRLTAPLRAIKAQARRLRP
jgi:hypothetical protein